MKQQRDALLKEKETSEKVASRAFAQSYLADLVPSVFTRLSQDGFFYDPVERGVHIDPPPPPKGNNARGPPGDKDFFCYTIIKQWMIHWVLVLFYP